jgi:spore coat polysaccharide biosynthesis protein SpsF
MIAGNNYKYLTVAIIQARMGATRLPGKVLMDIAGKPMLVRVVERVRQSTQVDLVVVATSSEPEDNEIETVCEQMDYACYRGDLHDVLDRYYQAARRYSADVIVRLTADCPLIDPGVIDQVLKAFFDNEVSVSSRDAGRKDLKTWRGSFPWDFAANRLPPPWHRTFPIGLDTEVCTFAALERAWNEADKPHQREHVMPYLYEHEGLFRVLRIDHEPDYGHLRWTVDTSEDLEFVRQVYAFFQGNNDFSWLDVLALVESKPELIEINAGVRHKTLLD